MILDKLLRKSENLEVKRYFDKIASQWDSMSKEFYSEAVRDKILSMIESSSFLPLIAMCGSEKEREIDKVRDDEI